MFKKNKICFIISICFPRSISPQYAERHKAIEFPKGIFSGLKENLGNTLYVLSVLKNVGFISYESAKEPLPYKIDCFGYIILYAGYYDWLCVYCDGING